VLATFAASGVGYLGSSAAPVIVQALIDAGLSHRQAGDLGTIELMTLLLAMLGLVGSALADGYLPMIAGRLLIGSGSGLAIAGANAAIASRADAERIFAIIWTMGGAITALLAIGLPKLVVGGNFPLGFGVLLALCFAAVPLIFWIPPRPAASEARAAFVTVAAVAESPGTRGALPGAISAPRVGLLDPLNILTLLGIFVYSLAEMALWQFSFDIAVDNGIPYERVGYFLGVTGFVGLSGGAIAAWMGLRFRRVAPIVIGSLLSVVGRGIYITATSSEALFVAALFWGIGFYFVSPYQIGLAAALDRSGRVAVASAGVSNLGYGLGPTLGGRIRQYQLDHGLDPTILVVVIAGATLLSLLLLLPVALRLDREDSGTSE
jgi:predicted MFS family arabinose efflux permease